MDGQPQTICLALDLIENHAYERSRFLRGALVDEAKIEHGPITEAHASTLACEGATTTALRWVAALAQPGDRASGSSPRFELLDKPIVFADAQALALQHPAPLVLIGSAGSGKTAVTISRVREAEGRVLYVTLSTYLATGAHQGRALWSSRPRLGPRLGARRRRRSRLFSTVTQSSTGSRLARNLLSSRLGAAPALRTSMVG